MDKLYNITKNLSKSQKGNKDKSEMFQIDNSIKDLLNKSINEYANTKAILYELELKIDSQKDVLDKYHNISEEIGSFIYDFLQLSKVNII